MKAAVASRPKTPSVKTGIPRAEISQRLTDLDIAHTSALRDLEMDISGQKGIAAASVLNDARRLLRK